MAQAIVILVVSHGLRGGFAKSTALHLGPQVLSGEQDNSLASLPPSCICLLAPSPSPWQSLGIPGATGLLQKHFVMSGNHARQGWLPHCGRELMLPTPLPGVVTEVIKVPPLLFTVTFSVGLWDKWLYLICWDPWSHASGLGPEVRMGWSFHLSNMV